MSTPGKRDPLPWLTVLLSMVGLAVSLYLLSYKLGNGPRLCVTGHGCADVNASAYSWFLGVPVAVYGIVAYLILLAAGMLWALRREQVPDWVLVGAFGLCAAGFAFSLYLTYLEAAVIHAYCSWCLTSFGLISALMLLFALGVRQRGAG